ncbi:MAG: hypothetical protein ACI4XL_04160 [Bacillus sp. (in: firmicutes)]
MQPYAPQPYSMQTGYPINMLLPNMPPAQQTVYPAIMCPYQAQPSFTEPERQQIILPPIDTAPLIFSTSLTTELLDDAKTISQTLNSSEDIILQLMQAAQASDFNKVSQLINGISIKHRTELSFTPGVLIITVLPFDISNSCCRVEMTLNWRSAF